MKLVIGFVLAIALLLAFTARIEPEILRTYLATALGICLGAALAYRPSQKKLPE